MVYWYEIGIVYDMVYLFHSAVLVLSSPPLAHMPFIPFSAGLVGRHPLFHILYLGTAIVHVKPILT
jgi:hypothetical protein